MAVSVDITRRLEAILNKTKMAVFLMDDRQHCQFANAGAKTALDKSPWAGSGAELLAKSFGVDQLAEDASRYSGQLSRMEMTNQLYERSSQLLEAELGEELLALDPQQGICFGFNEIATDIWRLLDRPRSARELVAELRNQYDVDEERCAADVDALLVELVAKRLVQVRPTEAA